MSDDDIDPTCAICGEWIDPPVRMYNGRDDPVHIECMNDALQELADALSIISEGGGDAE